MRERFLYLRFFNDPFYTSASRSTILARTVASNTSFSCPGFPSLERLHLFIVTAI